jgi:hypothetical protein
MKWVGHEVCEEQKCNRDFDVDTCGENRSVEVLRVYGDAIKMDVKAIEWKGLISLGIGYCSEQ